MERGERPVVAGVHGLQHVDRLGAAYLAHDDPVGPHTERVDEQHPLGHFALALDVGGPGLESHDVRLPQLELGRILDRDDALGLRDVRRQHVQQRRLSRAGTARDEHVEPAAHDRLEKREHRLGEALEADQVFAAQRVALELSDGEMRTVHGERLDDRVDTRPIGKTRVDHRRGVVDAPADRRDDPVDDLEEVPVVLEADVGALQLAVTLDVDALEGIHQDVRDRRILDQRLERAQPEDLVEHLPDEHLALVEIERHDLLRQQVVHHFPNRLDHLLPVDLVEIREVEAVEETPVDAPLDLLKLRRVDSRIG